MQIEQELVEADAETLEVAEQAGTPPKMRLFASQ